MDYKYLPIRGALHEVDADSGLPALSIADAGSASPGGIELEQIPQSVIELVPESLARENLVLPVAFDGETLTFVATRPDDIALADKLRFILNKNVRLVPASREDVVRGINLHYGETATEFVDSMLQEFTDTAIDFTESAKDRVDLKRTLDQSGSIGTPDRARLRGVKPGARSRPAVVRESRVGMASGLDTTPRLGGRGMLYYVVEEGQRVLMRRPNGKMEVICGPKRVWRGRNEFRPMAHYVAHPGEFLIIRYRDGRQQHLAGPSDVWFDSREHQEITREEALQLAAKEAVVVYCKDEPSGQISRRLVYGPFLFIPQPGEWLHTFSWHASEGGSRGAQKIPNALVFQKLWLMPDQMYHDVPDVRTADDAVLTIRLMIFFELVDIERMLDTTHDPIGDFVNAATSDVVDFTGKHPFEEFKRNTHRLNELETYKQLTVRASQCGYRINKVVFRGYGAAAALQQMHEQAIQARTRLQLDRATDQQAQELENFRLDCQLARSGKRRTEQTEEVAHDLEMTRRRQEAQIRQREALLACAREHRRLEAEFQLETEQRKNAQQQAHLAVLRDMSVDLTAFLTQSRADRVIELRGAAASHFHVDDLTTPNKRSLDNSASKNE